MLHQGIRNIPIEEFLTSRHMPAEKCFNRRFCAKNALLRKRHSAQALKTLFCAMNDYKHGALCKTLFNCLTLFSPPKRVFASQHAHLQKRFLTVVFSE